MTSSGTSGFSEVYSVTSASLLAAVLLTDIWREERWCTESSTATGGSRDAADDVTGNGTDDDPRGSAVTSHFYVSGKKMPAAAQGGGRPTNAAAQLKLLATAGACFGVAFSCHHISAVLVVPALCWLAAADARSISDGFWSMMVPALAALVRVHLHLHLHVHARACVCVWFGGRVAGTTAFVPCYHRIQSWHILDIKHPTFSFGFPRNPPSSRGVMQVPAAASYGSIMLVSKSKPILNWGGVNDLQTFWWHISGKMYSVNLKWPSDADLASRNPTPLATK